MSDATENLMRERYGGGRKRRWPLVVVAVIVVAALAWLVWAVWLQSTPKVTSALESFHIGDHTSRATLQIRLSSTDVHPTCRIEATAEDHSPVGDLAFTLSNPTSKTFTVTRTLRTDRRPTAIESLGCTAPGQKHPR